MSDPKLIPLYDESAAIACTISDSEIPQRIELFERMRRTMSGLDRTPTGLLLHFPDQPAVRADLEAFVIDEKRCCQFWGFDVVEERDGVALRWDGPPAANELLDELETFFTTDAPLSRLAGLL